MTSGVHGLVPLASSSSFVKNRVCLVTQRGALIDGTVRERRRPTPRTAALRPFIAPIWSGLTGEMHWIALRRYEAVSPRGIAG